MGLILSIDQGTTGTTAALIDSKSLKLLGKTNKEFPQIYPKPGWVEHNLDDIWATVASTITEVITKCDVSTTDIVTIGITNQRETICAFDKQGHPLHNAIVWQDRRTHEFCKSHKESHEAKFKVKTGLPLDPYFSASKMRWLLENSDTVKEHSAKGDLLFGTIDTFLIYKLTHFEAHKTEASNASRTLLLDINSGAWCDELCDFFNVPKETLPSVESSFSLFGKTKGLSFLPDGIPISGVLGDQQAALFGQAGLEKGMSKCTYGTGAFYLQNTGNDIIHSRNGLLTTIAYRENGVDYYALEGSCYIAGAAVQWLRDNLKIINNSGDVEALAKNASDDGMENILFLPFFSGLGSPYWISDAQAAIVGLTRDSGNSELARACLEGICLSINDLMESFEKDSGHKVKELRVDGGAVVNDFLMQLQSNFSETSIIRPVVIETTAFGAACAAGIGSELFTKEELLNKWQEDKVFNPQNSDYYKRKKNQWNGVIKRLYL
ncbi:MAG: glycerol kinase GlpK [Bdellovibrionota bacterium]|nr:glycerol kinase GlpK [Bdellovibrionota bacterium]